MIGIPEQRIFEIPMETVRGVDLFVQFTLASMENRSLKDVLTTFERHNGLVLALLEDLSETKCRLTAEEMAKKHIEEENESLREIIRTDKVSLVEMQNVITSMEKQLSDLQALYLDAIKISLKARISEDKMPHILAEVKICRLLRELI